MEELIRLILEKKPLIVIKGIKRIGKTSLIRVAFNELKVPHVIVDLRGINPNSRKDLYLRFQSALNKYLSKNASIFRKLKDSMKLIRGVQVGSFGVTISWKHSETLHSLISLLEREGFVIVFDEVQEARGLIGSELAKTIAHFYDYGEISFVLSGSEIGLLYDFIGVENPEAPLYGRVTHEVELSRFTEEQSLEFLKIGFQQANVKMSQANQVDEGVLMDAVSQLDGIVGWLVKFGVLGLMRGLSKNLINEVLEEASKLSLAELEKFLSKRPLARRRYLTVLTAIASGKNRWHEIKEYLEEKEERAVQDSVLSRILGALLKSSFIEKIVNGRNIYYEITDPVLKYSLLKR